MNFRSTRILLHILALAMTLSLALVDGHWFWWLLTGFNVWVAASTVVWLLWRQDDEADGGEQRPSTTHRHDARRS